MSEYEEQANDFAKKHGITLDTVWSDHRKYFPEDKRLRDVFECTLERNGESYTFEFGQSISNEGVHPTMYDVLTCLTKYDPETFEDFCDNYGYDEDSRKAEKIYHNVVDEWENVERLFGDILEELSEIE